MRRTNGRVEEESRKPYENALHTIIITHASQHSSTAPPQVGLNKKISTCQPRSCEEVDFESEALQQQLRAEGPKGLP